MRKLALVLAGWLTGVSGRATAAPPVAAPGTGTYALARQRMVEEQLVAPGRDITNARASGATLTGTIRCPSVMGRPSLSLTS
jgi:hypothetical protein